MGLKDIRFERFSCMPILSTRLGMTSAYRDLFSTSGHHRSRKQSTLPGCTWDMHFPLQPSENAESQPAFPSRRLSFERPLAGWLVKEAEHSRCINDFECALYATRPWRSFAREKKKNVSDLPGRLESCRCCRGDFSFLKLLSTGLWTIFVFSIKNKNIKKAS